MATLFRVRTALTGFAGGPGVATMYFLDAATAINSVWAFWGALSGQLPDDVTAQVEESGEVIESTTGALLGTYTRPAVTPIFGASTAGYSAPTGATVSWLTNTISGRNFLRGRTFIVPLGGQVFDTNGSLLPGKQDIIKVAADALLSEQSTSMVVWGRPRAARAADGSRPAVSARAGTHGLVTGTRVPTKAAILRSRRD